MKLLVNTWILFNVLFISSFTACSLQTTEIYRAVAENGHLIEAKYGPEFSFTDNEIIRAMKSDTDYNNPVNKKKLELWKGKVAEMCNPDLCSVSQTSDKHGKAYRITFPDDWWFQMGIDTGCLEVQTTPSTLATFRDKKEIMEKFIFGSAKDLGMKPHERIGGGHLNVDLVTGFDNGDARLFRNFVVDRINNPELVWGIFGNHMGNAPPVSALERRLHWQMENIIKEFDEKGIYDFAALQNLAQEIEKRVYVSNPFWLAEGKSIWTPSYYQDLNFRNVKSTTPESQRRVEIRGYRPQQSIDEFLLEMEYMDARLTYLKNLEQDLEVKIPKDYEFPRAHKIVRFKEILTEMGLPHERYELFFSGPIARGRFDIPNPPQPSCRDVFRRIINL